MTEFSFAAASGFTKASSGSLIDPRLPPFDPWAELVAPGARPDAEADGRLLLAKLWREVEPLPPLLRLAYLLNFTDGKIEWFWYYGIASIRQMGKTLQLTNEQFNRAWVFLEWNQEQRERARLLTTYDEKFAMMWQQLPLNDLTIAALLETTQQNVIHLRQAARQRLCRKMSSALATSQPQARQ